jgi:hypothetical protein
MDHIYLQLNCRTAMEWRNFDGRLIVATPGNKDVRVENVSQSIDRGTGYLSGHHGRGISAPSGPGPAGDDGRHTA